MTRCLTPTPGQTVGPVLPLRAAVRRRPRAGAARRRPARCGCTAPCYDGARRRRSRTRCVEIRQADADRPGAAGRGLAAPRRRAFTGWGRAATDPAGRYCVHARSSPARPRRAARRSSRVTVFARGLLDRLFTRAYLPGPSTTRCRDPLPAALEPAQRARLVAVREADGCLRFDVRLQGERRDGLPRASPGTATDERRRLLAPGLPPGGRRGRRRRAGRRDAAGRGRRGCGRWSSAGLVDDAAADAVARAADDLAARPRRAARRRRGRRQPRGRRWCALLRDASATTGGAAAPCTAGSPARTCSTPRWCCSPATRCARVRDDLAATAGRAGRRSPTHHRDTVMAGRTLTQYAVPIDVRAQGRAVAGRRARRRRRRRRRGRSARCPVQCGGAAGTRALLADLAPDADPAAVGAAFADELGLRWPRPAVAHPPRAVTRIGDALVERARRARRRGGRRAAARPARDRRGARGCRRRARRLVDHAAQAQPGARACWSAAPPCRRRCSARSCTSPPRQAVDERPDGAWHASGRRCAGCWSWR